MLKYNSFHSSMEEEMTCSPFSHTNSTDDSDFKPSEGGGGCNNENLS